MDRDLSRNHPAAHRAAEASDDAAPGRRARTDALDPAAAPAAGALASPLHRWSAPTAAVDEATARAHGLVQFDASASASASASADVAGEAGRVHAVAARGVAGAGGALPHLDAIQASFGHHDVSGVVAHVGGDAAAAAKDLGARGYATGDHVAFSAAPDLHLAAHEAAHVVQQRGGVRLAGGVGRAGDPFERHADAVADAVVRGESAQALLDQHAHRGAGGGPAVQRYETDAAGLERIADVSEDVTRDSPPTDAVSTMSNVGDIDAARAEIARVEAARARLARRIDDGVSGFDAGQYAQNETVIGALRDFIFQAEGQTDTIGVFQAQYQQLRIDHARLSAQIELYRASDHGESMRGREGAALGQAAVEATGVAPGGPVDRGDADQGQLRNDANQAYQQMMALSRQVPGEWASVTTSREQVYAALRQIASGTETRASTAERRAHTDLSTRVAEIASNISAVVGVAMEIGAAFVGPHASGAMEARGIHEDTAGDIHGALAGGAGDLVGMFTQRIVQYVYREELTALEREAGASESAETQAQLHRNLAAVRAADTQLHEHLRQYLRLVADYDHAKHAYRDAVRNSAGAQDSAGGGGGAREGVIGELTAESGAFLAQLRTTQDLGQQLLLQGGATAATRRGFHHGEGGPMQWYDAVQTRTVITGAARWEPVQHTVDIAHVDGRGGRRRLVEEHTGEEANDTTELALSGLARMRASIEAFHREVAAPLGLRASR